MILISNDAYTTKGIGYFRLGKWGAKCKEAIIHDFNHAYLFTKLSRIVYLVFSSLLLCTLVARHNLCMFVVEYHANLFLLLLPSALGS